MDQDQIFEGVEIRDTSSATSNVSQTGEFTAETLLIENTLNEAVTLQLQGCLAGHDWFDIGDSVNVPASTNDYETVTDYFPCYRMTAICSVAPTSGDLEVWIIKSKR